MAIESMNRDNTEFDISKMVSAKLWSANLLYDGIYTFSDAFETNAPAFFIIFLFKILLFKYFYNIYKLINIIIYN